MSTHMELINPMRHERDVSRIVGRVLEVVAARFDVVAPQASISMVGNQTLALSVPEPIISDDGVVTGDLEGPFTRTALGHLAERLRIPRQYLDRLLSDGRPELHQLGAHNINELARVDDRRALYRYLRTDEGYLLRAVRSDKYNMIDNDSAFKAIMAGLADHELGIGDCQVEGDLTVDRLRVRLHVPAIAVAAEDLLGDYKSPFGGASGKDLPLIFAGVEITNSETGGGAFAVAPRAVVQVCTNGMTRAVEFRRAHLGAIMDEGTVEWSERTRTKALGLITSQVIDAVGQFISVPYLEKLVDEMRAAKGIDVKKPSTAIEVVTSHFKLTEGEASRLLDFFAVSGDTTVFGLSQAVTAMAQEASDGDRQAELELVGAQIVARPKAFTG